MISAVITTRNRPALLVQAVKSIQDQTYQDFEIIIANDASTDHTQDVLVGLANQDPRIRCFHLETNQGPGAARNFGIAQAQGEYVAILDDDDRAVPHRLETQLQFLQQKELDFVFSPVYWVMAEDRIGKVFPGQLARGEYPNTSPELFGKLYLDSNKIPNTSIFFRKALFQNLQYPVNPWIGEDWYLFMQMAARHVRMDYLREPLVFFNRVCGHSSLMRQSDQAFKAQRKVLYMMRQWLAHEGITQFDHLHARALANQLVREARGYGRFRCIALSMIALYHDPENQSARNTLRELIQRGIRKIVKIPTNPK